MPRPRRSTAYLPALLLAALLASLAQPAAAQRVSYVDGPAVIAAIPLPALSSSNLTVDEGANRLYFGNDAESISVLDGATHALTSVPSCLSPVQVLINAAADRLYALCSGALTVIDRSSLQPLGDLAIDSYPSFGVVDEAAGRLYTAHPEDDTVWVIDAAASSAVAVLDLPDRPIALGLMPAIGRLAVLSADKLSLVDTASLAVVATVDIPGAAMLAVSRFTNRAYVTNPAQEHVTVVDGRSAAVSKIATLPSAGEIFADSARGQIYWMHPGESTYTIFQEDTGFLHSYLGSGHTPETGAVDERNGLFYALPNYSPYLVEVRGSSPIRAIPTRQSKPYPQIYFYGISVNGLTRRAYVIDTLHHELLVIDTAAQAPPPNRTNLPIPGEPIGVATNPITGRTYVASRQGGLTVVADGVARTIPTLAGAQNVAIDPVANRVFVGMSRGLTAGLAIVDGRSEQVVLAPIGAMTDVLLADPLTGRALAAVRGPTGQSLLAVDGATGQVTEQVALPDSYVGLALDPQRRRLYVALSQMGALEVRDADSLALLRRLDVGGAPRAMALNVVTGDLFAGDEAAPVVWIARGADLGAAPIRLALREDWGDGVGDWVASLAVNPTTNTAYALLGTHSKLAVIDGASGSVVYGPSGNAPGALALDLPRDQVYVANMSSPFVTAYQGRDIVPWALVTSEGELPFATALAVDPLSGQLFVANTDYQELAIFDLADGRPAPIRVTLSQPPDQAPSDATPTFDLAVESDLPLETVGVYVQVDGRDGPWAAAARRPDGRYRVTLPPLAAGEHTLYAFALDAHSAGRAPGQPAALSAVAAHRFTVAPGVSFPTTKLIDNFNRRDGALGLRWVGGGLGGYRISGRAVDVGAGGPAYWSKRFAHRQEAYIRLTAIDPDGEHGLLLKVESRRDVVDWRYGAIRVSYAPAAGLVRVTTYQPRVGWRDVAAFPASLAPGDRLGARAGADGRVPVFHGDRLLGTADTTATNGSFFARGERGRVGVWFVGAEQAAFDDLGGGSAAPE